MCVGAGIHPLQCVCVWQNHVAFLHEEFLKLPSFPRKALETEFDMYGGEWGKVSDSQFSCIWQNCSVHF